MKKAVAFIAFLNFAIFQVSFCQTSNFEKEKLIELYKQYIGKEVYCFLLADGIRIYKSIHLSDEPTLVFSSILINLTDSIYVDIQMDELKFQDRFNENREWNKELLFKEKISTIIFTTPEEKTIAIIR